jgi:hypothetical protein
MRRQPIFGRTEMSSASGFYADPRRSVGFGTSWVTAWPGEGEFEEESESIIGELIKRSPQLSRYALVRAIPDDPDYGKHVPIEYRLDAKAIVGEFAVDMQHDEPSIKRDLLDLGIKLADKFLPGVELTVAGSLALLEWTVGRPYREAAEVIAARAAASGFSAGAVMGADGRSWRLVRNYIGNRHFYGTDLGAGSAKNEATNYFAGLVAGYVQGRKLSNNQRTIFWHDLGHRMGDQSYRGPKEQWGHKQWVDWYVAVAAIFYRDHLVYAK